MSTSGKPGVTASTRRRIVIELDLPDYQAEQLANAIYESRGAVGNWQSDPAQLIELEDAIRDELEKAPSD
jgi:hypothetical protein